MGRTGTPREVPACQKLKTSGRALPEVLEVLDIEDVCCVFSWLKEAAKRFGRLSSHIVHEIDQLVKYLF
jgi:hypothetical protein